jgi:hypothetical protein
MSRPVQEFVLNEKERQSDVSAASSLYKRTMEEMADRLCRYESAGACGGMRTDCYVQSCD